MKRSSPKSCFVTSCAWRLARVRLSQTLATKAQQRHQTCSRKRVRNNAQAMRLGCRGNGVGACPKVGAVRTQTPPRGPPSHLFSPCQAPDVGSAHLLLARADALGDLSLLLLILAVKMILKPRSQGTQHRHTGKAYETQADLDVLRLGAACLGVLNSVSFVRERRRSVSALPTHTAQGDSCVRSRALRCEQFRL